MGIKLNEMIKVLSNKSQLKEYIINGNNIVYLKDGDEFQIKLFNPFNFVLGAKVIINGTNEFDVISIRPGENIVLDHYLDDSNNTFRFSTYEIKNEKNHQALISQLGEITVNFYKEYKYSKNNVCDNKLFEVVQTESGQTNNINISKLDNRYCQSISENENNYVYYISQQSIKNILSGSGNEDTKTVGIIEPGKISNQIINTNYYNFKTDILPFVTETVKILPSTETTIHLNDTDKFCYGCGRKINQTYKFCPECGNKLN